MAKYISWHEKMYTTYCCDKKTDLETPYIEWPYFGNSYFSKEKESEEVYLKDVKNVSVYLCNIADEMYFF